MANINLYTFCLNEHRHILWLPRMKPAIFSPLTKIGDCDKEDGRD